jgi:hypothetical protein
MKKIFLPLLGFMTILFASCTKEHYKTENVAPYTFTGYYTVYSSDWKLYDAPPTPEEPDEMSKYTYFYFDFAVPELTDEVFDYGVMAGYITNDGNKSIVFPLPYDDFYANSYMWTEQATCEFTPGNVRFVVKYNDFDLTLNPATYTFMVRFLW